MIACLVMKEKPDSHFLALTLVFNMSKLYMKIYLCLQPFMGSKDLTRSEFMTLSRQSFKSMPKQLHVKIFG